MCRREFHPYLTPFSELPLINGRENPRTPGLVNGYAHVVCSLTSVIAVSIGVKRLWRNWVVGI